MICVILKPFGPLDLKTLMEIILKQLLAFTSKLKKRKFSFHTIEAGDLKRNVRGQYLTKNESQTSRDAY